MASRAPSGHAPEDRRRLLHRHGHPPGLPAPTALAEPRVRLPRALPRPPPSVLGVSHALDGLHPATPVRACFIPVTLMGFRLQGFIPPGKPHASRRRCSPVVRAVAHACACWTVARTSELCSSQGVRTATGRNPATAAALLTFVPLRLSLAARVGPAWSQRLAPPQPLRPLLPRTSPCGCASECRP
jgi:hypothetical protein